MNTPDIHISNAFNTFIVHEDRFRAAEWFLSLTSFKTVKIRVKLTFIASGVGYVSVCISDERTRDGEHVVGCVVNTQEIKLFSVEETYRPRQKIMNFLQLYAHGTQDIPIIVDGRTMIQITEERKHGRNSNQMRTRNVHKCSQRK